MKNIRVLLFLLVLIMLLAVWAKEVLVFSPDQSINLTYKKQRKHSLKQTRKMTVRLLAFLGKILGEICQQMRVHPDKELLTRKGTRLLDVITRVLRQQKKQFRSGNSREVSLIG